MTGKGEPGARKSSREQLRLHSLDFLKFYFKKQKRCEDFVFGIVYNKQLYVNMRNILVIVKTYEKGLIELTTGMEEGRPNFSNAKL